MSLATVPIGNRPPPILSPNCVQMKFHHAQQRLGNQLHLERSQDRLFGPRAALLHAQTLFLVAEAVLLAEPRRPGRHDLRSTKASRAADQVPRFAVAFHLEDIGMHQMVLAGDRPLDQDPSGAETAHAAIDVGSAPLPRHVPPRVVLRAGKALAPLPWTPPAGRFLLFDHRRFVQTSVVARPGDEVDPPLSRSWIQAGPQHVGTGKSPIQHGQKRGSGVAVGLAKHRHRQLVFRQERLVGRQGIAADIQPGGGGEAGPRPAWHQAPEHHPVVRQHGLGAVAVATTGLMEQGGSPDARRTAVPLVSSTATTS